MKQVLAIMAFFVTSLLINVPAHALLGDFRLTYGDTSGKPKKYNDAYFSFNDGPKISSQSYLGADAILILPMMPLGIGLRYESAGDKDTAFAETIKYSITRLALILNFRLIDTGIYLGPIATYGLSHKLKFDIPTDPDSFKSNKSQSYSIGLEGGVKLGLFRIGAEAGHSTLIFDDLKDITGVLPTKNGLTVDKLDFSGSYYKIHLGFGF